MKHLDPLLRGIMFIPMEAAVMIVGPLSGRISDRYGARGLSSVGLLVNATAIFWFSTLQQDTGLTAVVVGLACVGVGRGLFTSPNASSIMSRVASERRGVANGVRATVTQTASVLSVPLSLTFMSVAMPYDRLSQITQGAVTLTSEETTSFLSALRYPVHVSAFLVLLAIVPSLLRGGIKDTAGTQWATCESG